ncbi:MAG: UvrD-helicase domain-containing protein [Actinomycetota bacterium]
METIAGFCLRYAGSFPVTSSFEGAQPRADEWNEVYPAASRLIRSGVGSEIVKNSYSGVFVDEYQDCQIAQHDVVMALAEILPCRLVGDPLQAVFNFPKAPTIDWNKHVAPEFERLDDLTYPWRWKNANTELGEWLGDARARLSKGEAPDYASGPITYGENSIASQIETCHRVADLDGSAIAIGHMASDAHDAAARLGGRFTSMEEMECADLIDGVARLEEPGPSRVANLIDLAASCMTAVGVKLKAKRNAFASGKVPKVTKRTSHPEVLESLIAVAESEARGLIIPAMHGIESILGSVLYRRELWRDLGRVVREGAKEADVPLSEIAWLVRDRWRHGGRALDSHMVSRTLLIKGLEFDHAVVLNVDRLPSPENTYVAITRGSKSLTVLASA